MDKIQKKERKNWFYSYSMIFDLKISEHAKIIYLYLCRRADEEGQSFPSHKTMGEACGIKSRQTVINAVKELQEAGLLSYKKRANANGSQTSNLYVIYDSPDEGKVDVISKNKTVERGVQQMDTPCLADGHPPVHEIDTPCPADGHEGLSSEVLPIIKDYPINLSSDVEINHKDSTKKIDGRIDNINQELKNLLARLQTEELKQAYPQRLKDIEELEMQIMDMYLKKEINIQGDKIPQFMIHKALSQLTYFHVEYLLQSYDEICENTEIKNVKLYIQTMIYNAALQYNAKIKNDAMGYKRSVG